MDGRTILATPVAPLFIKIWLGPIPHYFSYQDKCVVSSLILSFKSCFPKEYDRKGRSLDDIHYRKAIDFFFFSFVFWPFYFETCPKSGKWVHFIHLHVAVSLHSKDGLPEEVLVFCESCLEYFVYKCGALNGSHHLTYNVHSLIHCSILWYSWFDFVILSICL